MCREGRAKEAAAALEKLHMKKALTGAARVALAQAYYEVFRLKDAERYYREAASSMPADAMEWLDVESAKAKLED